MTQVVKLMSVAMSSLFFSMLFNIKGKKLVIPPIGAMLVWLSFDNTAFLDNEIVQCFIATIIGTMYTEILARVAKTPTTTFLLSTIIILIPGGHLYYAVSSALYGDWNSFSQLGLKAISYAGAIAGGIILVSSLVKIIVNLIRQLEKI